MTDRELLEAAARAYWGDEIDDVCTIRWLEEDQAIGYTHGDNQDHNGQDREFVWNPLTDDGDALRLAVKLRIRLQTPVEWYQNNTDHFYCSAAWVDAEGYEEWESVDFKLSEGGDPYTATRRAIVLAAAAIARATHKEGAQP